MDSSSAFAAISEDLTSLIPHASLNILIVDQDAASLVSRLSERTGVSVSALSPHALAEVSAPLDAIVLNASLVPLESLTSTLNSLKSILSERGFFIWVQAGPANEGSIATPEEAGRMLGEIGLIPYVVREIELHGAHDSGDTTVCGFVISAVRPEYNPLTHARDLFAQGYAARSFEILKLIPDALLQNPSVGAQVAAEKMLCLLAWDRTADASGRLRRFFQSQVQFFEAVSNAPDMHMPYICQAEFWNRIGDFRQAAWLLSIIQNRVPIDEVGQKIEALSGLEPRVAVEPEPPAWRPTVPRPPRLLFVLPACPHYGLDILYDGLCTALGDENVTDFPWKPTLHGEAPTKHADYPCCFRRGGSPSSLQQIQALLEAGSFDAILFGDLDRTLSREVARLIVQAGKDVPLFVVDQQDDPIDNYKDTLSYLGVEKAQGYFKREKLLCHDYGPNAVSLPFAYADSRIPEALPVERTNSLFWAGYRLYGARRPVLEHVEGLLGIDFNRRYSQIEYSEAIRNALIGLNLCGYGFDTVRYWELSAHGCMVLSERLPIHIPFPFEDGKHAVYFDDIDDLSRKLQYFIAHPEEARTIAEAGRAHLKTYHTGAARARQLLGIIQSRFLEDTAWPQRR